MPSFNIMLQEVFLGINAPDEESATKAALDHLRKTITADDLIVYEVDPETFPGFSVDIEVKDQEDKP